MREQQINFQYCPPHGDIKLTVLNKQTIDKRSQFIAVKRLKQLHRCLPYSFNPFNNKSCANYHQSILANGITLHNGNSQFCLNSVLYDRQRLSSQRQMMYCRGALSEQILCEEVLQEMIKQGAQNKGYVDKKGNRSVIVHGMLIYVSNQKIMGLRLPEFQDKSSNKQIQVNQQSLCPITLFTFPDNTMILQVKLFDQSYQHKQYVKCNNNLILLLIRLQRQIVLLNLQQQRISDRKQISQGSHEFICCQKFLYNQKIIETVEYNGSDSIMRRIGVSNRDIDYRGNLSSKKQHILNEFTIKDELINSVNRLSRNGAILVSSNDMKLYDDRANQLTQSYSTNYSNQQTIHNDHIYLAKTLANNFTYSPYIATCQTRHICLFDIRNLSSPVEKRLHHCQQSPPQIMLYFDGLNQILSKPVLAAWSPYHKGVGIMTSVDSTSKLIDLLNITDQKDIVLGKNFRLLSQNNNQSNSFIQSLSMYNYSTESLAMFSATNQGAINMQLYHHDQQQQRYEPYQIIEKNKPKSNLHQQCQETNNNQKWFKANISNKYFTKSFQYSKLHSQSKITMKKSSKQLKKKNIKNYKRIQQSTKSKQVNNTFDQQSLSADNYGQYETQQHCEESFTKRKLNFVDLTNFYNTLKAKAKYLQSMHQVNTKTTYQLQNSLASTQPYSDGFSLSHSLPDQSIQPFTFYNKFNNTKIISTPLINKLKSQWNQ